MLRLGTCSVLKSSKCCSSGCRLAMISRWPLLAVYMHMLHWKRPSQNKLHTYRSWVCVTLRGEKGLHTLHFFIFIFLCLAPPHSEHVWIWPFLDIRPVPHLFLQLLSPSLGLLLNAKFFFVSLNSGGWIWTPTCSHKFLPLMGLIVYAYAFLYFSIQ